MSRANLSATSGVRPTPGRERSNLSAAHYEGAEKVTVPFPDAGADAWDSYEYTKLAESNRRTASEPAEAPYCACGVTRRTS